MFSKQLEFYKSNFETQFCNLAHFFDKTALRNIETRSCHLHCMFYVDTVLNDLKNRFVD